LRLLTPLPPPRKKKTKGGNKSVSGRGKPYHHLRKRIMLHLERRNIKPLPSPVAREALGAEEALAAEALAGLARDAGWVKSYAAAALLITKDLMQADQPFPRVTAKPCSQKSTSTVLPTSYIQHASLLSHHLLTPCQTTSSSWLTTIVHAYNVHSVRCST
jgi:hypothetical protein